MEKSAMRSTTRLSLETLGERTLLSSGSTIPTEHLVPIIQHHVQHINGTVHGDFSVQITLPDAGTPYQFNASAHLRDLGNVTVSGTITTTGNVLHGHATGQLTITGTQGQVVLELTGPLQKGGGHLPGHYNFRVMNATGNYAGLKDHGIISLQLAIPHSQGTDHSHGKFWMLIS